MDRNGAIAPEPRWARALVTGASSGIGRQFALTLAAEGTDLVLVARTTSALEELAAELRSSHGVDAEVLTADLADPTAVEAVAQRIAAEDAPVDLVVNNAGAGRAGKVRKSDPATDLAMIQLNIAAVLRLSQAAAAAMTPRGRGGILNVASLGGMLPTPGFATYTSSKAWVISFTESLHGEQRGTGVNVSVLCPGYVDTPMLAGQDMPGFLLSDPVDVVREGLDALAANKTVCVPGLVYKGASLVSRALPRAVVRRLMGAAGRR